MMKTVLKTLADQKCSRQRKIRMHSLRAGELVHKAARSTPARHPTSGHLLEMKLRLFQKMKLRTHRIQFV
jgi:hypothetical protein